MKLISWNVNGLRAVLKSTLPGFLASTNADIYCFQEIKAMREQVDAPDFPPPGYHAVWNSALRKGYSGTLVLTKLEPLSVTLGLGYAEHDDEGRVITCEFEDFYLVNVYTPNAKNDLSRLAYRHDQWDRLFLEHMRRLDAAKPVLVCGDLNVAHREIDLARPKENVGCAGFTPEEREGFDNFMAAGFVDSFRHLHPDEEGHYTWWSFRANARERNIGWRIDYWLMSPPCCPA
ncbi:MAG: exodeoxyribonuclease III [Opitutales bacterium]